MAGGANAINMWFDRDIDLRMARTRLRPIPAGRISAGFGLAFGVGLGLTAFAVFWYRVNALSAWLALAGLLFYVFIYTVWLKRTSPQNIVIGGAAGAFPPLIGWVAATGDITILPVLMFAIIFLWTPPHFWALSLFVRSDYAAAGIPMLPVVAGIENTRRQIFLYTLPMVAAAIAPWPLGLAGAAYGVAAAVLGFVFLVLAGRVLANRAAEPTDMAPEKHLFAYSVFYLFALFAALVADRWIA
jgi:protoheme IX farnesyltransferase